MIGTSFLKDVSVWPNPFLKLKVVFEEVRREGAFLASCRASQKRQKWRKVEVGFFVLSCMGGQKTVAPYKTKGFGTSQVKMSRPKWPYELVCWKMGVFSFRSLTILPGRRSKFFLTMSVSSVVDLSEVP